MLISEMLEAATDQLSEAGVISPSVDSEILAGFVLGVARSELTKMALTNQFFPEDKTATFKQVIARRAAREPLQHITGLAAFRHIELEVGLGVFIPRPETESLVDLAMGYLTKIPKPKIVDLCSGSGAIAIALGTELENSEVFAVELSEEAVYFLKRNFQKYGLDPSKIRNENLEVSLSNMAGLFDAVVANPPYIPDQAVPIDLEVALHDPGLALYGGEDGLDVIRKISTRALLLLKPAGHLVIEHASTQAAAVRELLLAEGWKEVNSFQDLAGKDRMISAIKP